MDNAAKRRTRMMFLTECDIYGVDENNPKVEIWREYENRRIDKENEKKTNSDKKKKTK